MDFSSILQTWIAAVSNPNEEFYEAERTKPEATINTAVIWVLIATVIAAVLGALRTIIGINAMGGMEQLLSQMDMPPEMTQQMTQMLSGGAGAGLAIGSLLFSLILTPIFFLIGVGIFYLVARMLGGQGDYGRYAYLISTFYAPLTVVSSVLGFVPLLGGCAGLIIVIYQVVLTYFATKVEHRLTSGKAIAVALTPIIIFGVFFVCIAGFAGAFILSNANG
ncbi:MAG: YIP1 family protein [Caldilineaceae bacterium]|nr:YIP1 family protein [Caldilineaceae bacterium]MCB0142973.1 YIP1 family protein [Caldilineaceae bacterium]